MTPEREAQIREYSPHWAPGSAITDLLAEIDRLRVELKSELRWNETIGIRLAGDVVREQQKYARLKEAAKEVCSWILQGNPWVDPGELGLSDMQKDLDALRAALKEKHDRPGNH